MIALRWEAFESWVSWKSKKKKGKVLKKLKPKNLSKVKRKNNNKSLCIFFNTSLAQCDVVLVKHSFPLMTTFVSATSTAALSVSEHTPFLFPRTSPTFSLSLSLSSMAEEQEPLHGLMLRRPLMSTTFAVPLSRYTTSLISAADHPRILLGDCVGSHLDADDDAGRSIYGDACVFSKPILVLDVVWNFAFVMVSMVVLLSTFKERPSTPLRLWILGYSLQCILHVGFVYFEYQRKWCADIVGLHAVSASHGHTRLF